MPTAQVRASCWLEEGAPLLGGEVGGEGRVRTRSLGEGEGGGSPAWGEGRGGNFERPGSHIIWVTSAMAWVKLFGR